MIQTMHYDSVQYQLLPTAKDMISNTTVMFKHGVQTLYYISFAHIVRKLHNNYTLCVKASMISIVLVVCFQAVQRAPTAPQCEGQQTMSVTDISCRLVAIMENP